MQDLKDTWALITGASSGLGIDFANLLAERGANLVLVARRLEPMQALAVSLQERYSIKVKVIELDLSKDTSALKLKSTLDQDRIHVATLINNAGFGLFGEFLEQDVVKTSEMLALNMMTLTQLTHVFAEDMRQQGGGQILLIASIGAYQATPTYAAYSASKSYVLLFGEALHHELARYNIKVSVLSPGITATSFLQVSGQKPTFYQRMVMMQSRPVAIIGLQALFAGKASVVPGLINKLTIFCNRFVPRQWQTKLAYLLMKN
ncbi:SDR family NAD(P)-dependent oxidoreductase [Undibacterium sp. Ji22W]|jgi:short-subunit dehydrogenase|uniref:SDR family NAD(P)-dependent oxidoreductase n=1 Tax=Undibacterium sp. Ji22W TaxID=3413038 RepID=UPI003BF1E843